MTARQPRRLFAYGTLMFPEVLRAVCGVDLPATPAVLHGYARRPVRGHGFPAIVAEPGASTDGMLIENLSAALWRRLDEFESDFYDRLPVAPVRADGVATTACAYVVAPRYRQRLGAGEWSPAHFRATQLDAYLARYT